MAQVLDLKNQSALLTIFFAWNVYLASSMTLLYMHKHWASVSVHYLSLFALKENTFML